MATPYDQHYESLHEVHGITIAIAQNLQAPGDTLERTGHLDVATYWMGDKCFELKNGINFDVALTHAGEGILATGIVRAEAVTSCDRCLDEAHVTIDAELQEYYLFEAPPEAHTDEAPEDDELEYDFVVNGEIDLAPAIEAAILLDTEFVTLCSPDCQGLCPHCGCNKNHESCTCEADNEISPTHPFAALKDLSVKK